MIRSYSTEQKRLLVNSTARFINLITQNMLDRDSVMLISCRLTGVPFLIAYSEDDSVSFFQGSDLINTGKIYEAKELLLNLHNDKQLQLSIDLAKWYLYKAGVRKKDLDSAYYYIQLALSLNTSGNDVKQFQSRFLLAEYYRQIGNIAKSQNIYLQIVSLTKDSTKKAIYAIASHRLGTIHPEIDSTDYTYLNYALDSYKGLQLKEREIELLWDMASYHLKADLFLFKSDLEQILRLQKSANFMHSLLAEHLLSFVCIRQSKYLEALEHANVAVENMKWSGMTTMEGTFYARLGVVYACFGKNEEALTWYKKGLEHRRRDNQMFWFKNLLFATTLLANELEQPEESLSLIHQITGENPPLTAFEEAEVYSIKGDCYAKLNNYRLADENYILFFNLVNKHPEIDRFGEFSGTYLSTANFYISKSNLRSARLFIEKVMAKDYQGHFSTIDLNYILFRLDSVAGNYKSALNYYTKYKAFDDSDKNMEQRKAFDELNVRYGAEKKDNDIKLLQNEKLLQSTMLQQEKYTRNWILSGVVLLLIIVALLAYNSKLKQRTNRKLENQRLEIEEQNFRLRNLVGEKDWLVKEIHHRVKNNLQIIMSLLNSQSVFIDNDVALSAIHDSQHRVQAMSLIHQKLYGAENLSSIDMSFYIRELVSYLSDSFNLGQRIRFELQVESIELDVSQAIPIGLILNEAITNSIKYAFPDGKNGTVTILFSQNELDQCLLIISDNGIGMQSKYHKKKSGSLGMSLIKGLSEDLNAAFFITDNNGTTIKITFTRDLAGKGISSSGSVMVNNDHKLFL